MFGGLGPDEGLTAVKAKPHTSGVNTTGGDPFRNTVEVRASTLDEFAPIGPDRELMKRFCAIGVTVHHVEHLLAEHVSETITGAPGAVAYLADRFAGKAPKNNCSSIPKP